MGLLVNKLKPNVLELEYPKSIQSTLSYTLSNGSVDTSSTIPSKIPDTSLKRSGWAYKQPQSVIF